MINKMKLVLLLSVLFLTTLTYSQNLKQTYLIYIENYYKLAQKQQKEFGIPASITLAQGLLESGAGQSALTKMSNNHFGIKCTDWQGDKVYYDDDAKGECFRKYDEALQSYEDHSMFLKNRKRYSFLFDLKPTDYESWALGLKKAGYATDPAYGYKLISIIENYNLHKFDLKFNENQWIASTKSNENQGTETIKNSIGTIDAFTNHVVKKVNGVRFVTASFGDTYGIISEEFNISEKKLRKYNDIDTHAEMKVSDRIFIASKKNKAPVDCLTHQVFAGETMRSIAQDYGIKLVDLYKLNSKPFEEGAKYAEVLKLR